ncbi:MAG TPA: radical SAM family heme chaperone HemW [Bacteroidia bacterium]|nr:radical SAM family heme chaperone HemW [Bacteroidia bacterium]
MPGIYIHIPFCTKACHYCDFHFSTSLQNKELMIEAILDEIDARENYLENKDLSTIYFGGGTPSLLTGVELERIIDKIKEHFEIARNAEITLEANPDDLTKEKINGLTNAGINRLSIGIQSFFDEDLVRMNRSHTAKQAIEAVENAKSGGINNISIDLIYGLPNLTLEKWAYNLEQAFKLDISHLSAYCLTIEEKTAFNHFLKKGKITLPREPETIAQFELLMSEAERHNYIHYEISNFCKENLQSRHNSSYWMNERYLGIGPSAHSYNGVSRQFNVTNNMKFIKGINAGKPEFEMEILTEENKFNEYIMTHLRTIWGISPGFIKENFGEKSLNTFLSGAEPYIESGHLQLKQDTLVLTKKGKLLADKIACDLFI